MTQTQTAANALQGVGLVIGLGVKVQLPTSCCTLPSQPCNNDPLGVVASLATPPPSENFVNLADFTNLESDQVIIRIISLLCPGTIGGGSGGGG